MYRYSAFHLAFVFLAFTTSAHAGFDNIEPIPMETEFMLEPLSENQGVDVKIDGVYASQPVGQHQRWRLDSGAFNSESTAPRLGLTGDDDGGYSGVRLRLPGPTL